MNVQQYVVRTPLTEVTTNIDDIICENHNSSLENYLIDVDGFQVLQTNCLNLFKKGYPRIRLNWKSENWSKFEPELNLDVNTKIETKEYSDYDLIPYIREEKISTKMPPISIYKITLQFKDFKKSEPPIIE